MAGRTVAENIRLSLGLVGTTVNLKALRSSEKADSLTSICPTHAATGVAAGVTQGYTCKVDPTHGPFGIKECAKGKKLSKTEIVPLTPDEIANVRAVDEATGKTMDLEFHPADQVAHLIPTGIAYAGVAAEPDSFYGVLAHQLANAPALVCMGKLVLRGKQKVFMVTVGRTGLVLSEMCRDADLYDVDVTDMSFDPKYLGLMGQLVEMVTKDYDPEAYRDRTAEKLAELLAAKADDPTATVTPLPVKAAEPEVDMLAAMEASLAALKAQKGEAA